MTFTDFVGRYQLARSEGLVLRYLTDAYRTLRHTVPEAHRTPELEELVEWLGETVRQTDSSLLDEWEALTDPEHLAERVAGEPPPPPRPISKQERVFAVMVRNAMFRRVELVARDDLDALVRLERQNADRVDPPREVVMTRSALGRRAWRSTTPSTSRSAPPRTPAARRCTRSNPPRACRSARRTRRRTGSGGSVRCSTTPRATTTG